LCTRTSLAAIAALLVLLRPAPTIAAQGAPTIVVTNATYLEVDDQTGLWQMRGDPVVVTRRAMTVRAPAMTFDSRRQVLTVTGPVSVEDEDRTLTAASVVVFLADERLLAEGEVIAVVERGAPTVRLQADRLEVWSQQQRALATGAVSLTHGPVTLTATELTYDLQAHHAIATGRPRAESPDATISGDRIGVQLDRDELTADGAVRITAETVEGTAPTLVWQAAQHLVTLSGGAIVRQGRNELRAEVIVVDLQRKQIIATGGAHVVVYPNP